uniref:GOLGA2L5 domain-containing protein n=1 Tax=Syphacia muris TaxID=451379 RepID=A0A0N5B076_9BILA
MSGSLRQGITPALVKLKKHKLETTSLSKERSVSKLKGKFPKYELPTLRGKEGNQNHGQELPRYLEQAKRLQEALVGLITKLEHYQEKWVGIFPTLSEEQRKTEEKIYEDTSDNPAGLIKGSRRISPRAQQEERR